MLNSFAVPVVLCPLGHDRKDELPVHVQIVGAPRSDRVLADMASDLSFRWVVANVGAASLMTHFSYCSCS
ncbi:unnamed protein product [Heligmosomoides polygyrus]|uniref:Transcriptional regulator n=1 Tax=Heligmosomoides polygyrus TaxID=6339 RepID=A0A183FA15_HELPZ|nr:unnamed protein product [Heligmosomoides polygyrus]